MYPDFIRELYKGNLAISSDGLKPYLPLIKQVLAGVELKDEKEPLRMGLFDEIANEILPPKEEDAAEKENAVAVIPIHGLMTTYGSWWSYGTVEYAAMLNEAFADPSIQAVVLDIDSPGGTTNSLFVMEEAIRKRNKPVIAAITGQGFSAAYYTAALADKIYAINRMNEIGSIGVMARIENDDKYWENMKIYTIEIVPPESNWKNKAYNEAKNGKPQLLIEEELSPWAINFQNIVKQNRPALDMSVEGLLNGRIFYAFDALNNGLIDEIKPLGDIIQEAFQFKTSELNKLFN